jgi:ribosomal protein L40E
MAWLRAAFFGVLTAAGMFLAVTITFFTLVLTFELRDPPVDLARVMDQVLDDNATARVFLMAIGAFISGGFVAENVHNPEGGWGGHFLRPFVLALLVFTVFIGGAYHLVPWGEFAFLFPFGFFAGIPLFFFLNTRLGRGLGFEALVGSQSPPGTSNSRSGRPGGPIERTHPARKVCPGCGQDNAPWAKSCTRCGVEISGTEDAAEPGPKAGSTESKIPTPQKTWCPECGEENAPAAKFCNRCGCDLRRSGGKDGSENGSESEPPVSKVPCRKCGAKILPLTAKETNGFCMPCARKR